VPATSEPRPKIPMHTAKLLRRPQRSETTAIVGVEIM